jgi:hypothetical protein
VNGLLSDRHRVWKLSAVILLSLGLGVRYDHLAQTVPFNWDRCMEDPVAASGRQLTMALWQVTAIDGPDRYEVSRIIRDVPVAGPTAGLSLGQTVSVVGTFSPDGPVVLESFRRAHPWRRGKVALGLIGVVCALVGLPMAFRWRSGRLVTRWPT